MSVVLPRKLVIASRQSRLALWQAEYVQRALQHLYPATEISILGLTTRGDQILDRPLSQVGGKGLFVKELENALADGRADLAVHSLKDVPVELPPDFALAAVLERGLPYDAFVSSAYDSLADLPAGSVVGTSSLRRESMLRACYPHILVRPLRGNIGTRLNKLDSGEYSALILAAAGLARLGLEHRIRAVLTPEESLPAAGQGALGIEICAERTEVARWLEPLHHTCTSLAVEAERSVARILEGNCEVPLAAFAVWEGTTLFVRGSIALPDGTRMLQAQAKGAPTTTEEAIALGQLVANDLAQQGAHEIIRSLTR